MLRKWRTSPSLWINVFINIVLFIPECICIVKCISPPIDLYLWTSSAKGSPDLQTIVAKLTESTDFQQKNNSNEQIIWRLINWRNWSWLNPQWFGLECYAAVFVQITFMVETGRNWAQQVLFIFCIAGRPRGHKDGQCDARKWPFGRLHNGSIITRPIIRACPPKYAKLTRVWFALASNGKSHGAIEFSKVSWLSDLGFGERTGGIQGTSSTMKDQMIVDAERKII